MILRLFLSFGERLRDENKLNLNNQRNTETIWKENKVS